MNKNKYIPTYYNIIMRIDIHRKSIAGGVRGYGGEEGGGYGGKEDGYGNTIL